MSMPQSRAPLIVAIVLLLLPVLYVGSYLALVVPMGANFAWATPGGATLVHYRYGGLWAERFFWPLEQVDRKIRRWNPPNNAPLT
jgi:hypothetical protein